MVPDAVTDGPRFAAFCERYIRHTKGRWAGSPFVLEDWQRDFWWEALEFDPATGQRVYNEVGLGIARKNGKSAMASAAAHYFLVADGEPEPEVYVAAAARNQAGIVLGQSRRMALQSPLLRPMLHVQRHLIECPRNGGIMRALSADAALQHGLNPSANIVDELHAHKSADLYTALTTGTSAREQPFTLWISTAGTEGGMLSDIYQGMLAGTGQLEIRGALTIYRDREAGMLIYWYGAPPDADIHDPDVWRASNPASWLQDLRALRKEYLALKTRGRLVDWRMYHLNQWVTHDEPWMPPDLWQATAGPVTFQPDRPMYVAVRVAHGHRIGALAVAQRLGDKVMVRVEVHHAPGADEYLDHRILEARATELRRRFPAPVMAATRLRPGAPEVLKRRPGPEVMYHGAFLEPSAQRLRKAGVVMSDVPSTPARIIPAAEALMQLATAGDLVHDGGDELAAHIAGVVARPAAQGYAIAAGEGPDGPRPIVAAQAAMLAVHRAMNAEPVRRRRMRSC